MDMQFYAFLFVILLAIGGCVVFYKLGYDKHNSEVLKRAKKIINSDKPCYDSQDLEMVVFGDTQE